MGTASPTTAIQKKVDVSVDDGQSKGDKVYFLEIWSIGSAPGDKTVEANDGKKFSGTFRQIQFKFDKDNNYIYTKVDDNQKDFDEEYSGTASGFTISGLSAGNAKTVVRAAKTNDESNLSELHNGKAESVKVKVEEVDGETELTSPNDRRPQPEKGANKDIITAFPTDPAAIGFNEDIAEYQDKGERQEVDIKAGAPHEEGVYVIYVKHNDRIGKDQYSLKLGMGGSDGEYEHTNQLGGVDHRAGWRWEAKHLQYTPSDVKATKVNPQMEERTERGLTTGFASKEQGFLLVKMRSPNNDATIYDVYVDDRDGQGWKWAYSNLFKDKNGGDHGCCDQTGRGYNDDDMRLEVRFQDQNKRLNFTAANYKPGRPNGYTSPSGL